MKILKSVKWTLSSEKSIEVKIEVTREMINDIAYADGSNFDLGKKLYGNTELKVFIDEKLYKNCFEPTIVEEPFYNAKTVKQVADVGGFAIMAGNVVITQAIYNEIMAAIAEAKIEASTDTEVIEHDAKVTAKIEKEEKVIAEMKTVLIPQTAISAYKHYQGDENKAWEDENETAWALIKKWAPYIEIQDGINN